MSFRGRQWAQTGYFYKAAVNPIDIVNLLEPVNYMEEKAKWLKSPGKKYNPQFIYNEVNLRASLYLAKKLRHELDATIAKYIQSTNWQSILTSQLLVSQHHDLDVTIPFLEAIVRGKIPKRDLAKTTTDQLFGIPNDSELSVINELASGTSAKEAILQYLIKETERSAYSKTRLETLVHTLCHDFEGILTPEEDDILSHKTVTPSQAADITIETIKYLAKYIVGGEAHIEVNMVDDSDTFAIARNPIKQARLAFEIPAHQDCFAADYILQCYSHEINSHLRVIISTSELIKDMPFHFQTNLITRSQRMLAQEGFASLNGDTVIADSRSRVFDPLHYILPAYAAEGHNFAEIVQQIYEYYDIDPDLDYENLHNDVWCVAQIFDGLKDTSSHCGYTFPWRQVYLLGPLRTLRELSRKDNNLFEDPLSMMRYSELPFEMIRNINHIEHDLGKKLAPDPFACWDFANSHPKVPSPTDYIKQLLLDL